MARRYYRRRFSGVFGGLGRFGRGGLGFINMGQIKSFAFAGVAGAVGVAATTQIVRRVMTKLDPNGKVPAWGRDLIGIGLGLLGARLLLRVNRDAAIGFAGGVIGYGVASLGLRAVGQPITFGGLRGFRGLRGADIVTLKPGRPQLAPVQKQSPVAGVVISQKKVPAYLMSTG